MTDLPQPGRERQFADALKRQGGEGRDAVAQVAERLVKGALLVDIGAFDGCRVLNAPVSRLGLRDFDRLWLLKSGFFGNKSSYKSARASPKTAAVPTYPVVGGVVLTHLPHVLTGEELESRTARSIATGAWLRTGARAAARPFSGRCCIWRDRQRPAGAVEPRL